MNLPTESNRTRTPLELSAAAAALPLVEREIARIERRHMAGFRYLDWMQQKAADRDTAKLRKRRAELEAIVYGDA